MKSRDKAKKKPTRRAGHPAMERYWNLVHYFLYRANYRLYLLLNKVNPILLLYRLPFARRRFKKMGIDDPVAALNEVLGNPENGLSVIWSGGITGGLVFLFSFGVMFLYSVMTSRPIHLTYYHAIPLLAVSFVVNHLLLFRKDKYLAYFEEFEKLPRKARRKWSLITFATVVGILAFAIGSCMNAPRG